MKTFTEGVKNFWNDEEGLQTLEILLIIAVIVVIALTFRTQIIEWVDGLISFGTDTITDFQSQD
jgi:Flp pilus assembly pilin Flp